MNSETVEEDGEFVSLDTLDFDTDEVMPELLLLTSLLLRAEGEIMIPSYTASAEYKSTFRSQRNVWLEPLIPNLLRSRISRREGIFVRGDVILNEGLPDVCNRCRTSFRLTVGGRIRHSCPHCHGLSVSPKDVHDTQLIYEELGVFAIPSTLKDIIVGQLVYKYYSPNGDPTWKIILPTM